ncbi:MAG TPA: hypothetical protein VJK27_06835 [Terriglobales bacterium]|jgi:photosystem II stability/assembly factor-like uncharacterized protein|nr:hypothetical protein [Terriglobales bacterium]
MRTRLVCFAPFLLLASLSFSQTSVDGTRHVSQALPIASSGSASSRNELSAERPLAGHTIAQPSAAQGNTWQLLATLPGIIIHDVDFPTDEIGYAVGEQGQVWKTTDGGTNWTQQNLTDAASDYFYGVQAITAKKVIITGFYDNSSAYGVFRWTENGGETWSSDMTTGPEWLQQVRFVKKQNGLMLTLGPVEGDPDTLAEYTSDGGAGVSDWNSADANPDGGWFGPQFSFLNNLHARASGINFCTSLTGGSDWTCGPSVDSVFDGPVFFLNDKDGYVGGGEISPNVEGWMHVTTNGGTTWSGRTLDGPWPIRSILFLTKKIGWAGGGNVYTDVGGMYFSTDGGNTWTVDVTTNSEMGSCSDHAISGHHQIWCAGFNYTDDNFNSVIYSTTY